MSKLKYDPELPFVVLIREDQGDDVILARCSTWDYANQLVKAGTLFREIVDTTPKPKIPEGAEFVTWRGDRNSILEFAEKTQGYWAWSGLEISEIALTEVIGDAEVTVLVRKDGT